MDCKLVGGGEGGLNDIVARVTIVNHDGILLLDRYVKPGETVTNYRTATTGITASDLYSGKIYCCSTSVHSIMLEVLVFESVYYYLILCSVIKIME